MSIANISYDGHGAGITNKYPYTDFHEMNLDWLLTTYQSIVNKLNETIDWCNNHQTEYEEAMRRLEAVENEIYTFEQQIRAEFAALQANLEAEFAQQQAELQRALQETQTQVDAAIIQMQNEVSQQLSDFVEEFYQLKAEVQAEINRLLGIINQAIESLNATLEANNQFIFNYVEDRLDAFIDMIPDYEHIYVYNPYRGEVTLLQQAINDLYSVAAIWGLTAAQYDSLELSASEYDNLGLSAIEYDTLGYKLLYKDPDLYMINPFTGSYDPVKTVIDYLAGLHKAESFTATEYDALELDADTYDAYECTAFNYDWFGKLYIV